jgi:hypothetical protein
MRITELVLGLVAAGAAGFALHAWLAGEGEEQAGPAATTARAPAEHEAPAFGQPVAMDDRSSAPLAPPAPSPAASPADEGRLPAADALVGILVHGAIVERDGRPVPVPPNRNWMSFDDGRGKPVSVPIAPSSTFSVAGLRPGSLTIRADQPGYRPYRHVLQLDAVRPVVRHDLVLEPAVVLLVKGFTPQGEPLVDAVLRELGGNMSWHAPRLSAIATREPPAGDLPPISHRAYDRWEIGYYSDRLDGSWNGTDGLPSDVMGKLELDEPLPAFVSLVFRHVLVATQLVEPGAQEVLFTVPLERLHALLGAVRVRVVDAATRQPPDGVTASLSDSQTGGGGDAPGPDGNFTWEGQKPGLLELEVRAPGHETWDQEVLVPAGGLADLGTIELSPETTITGFVVDEAGAPVAVSLRALRDDLGAGLGMGARRYAKSDAEGRFEIGELGRHRYQVSVSSEDWALASVPVDARLGDVDGVHLVLRRGALLRLQTDWPAGEAYDLHVAAGDGSTLARSTGWRGDWAWTRRVPPGDYVATLSRDGRELRRVPFTVGAEDVVIRVAP